MRYALIFAGVAAAYDAYGYNGYGDEHASSSTPAVKYSSSAPAYGGYGSDHKTSSAPTPSKTSSSSKIGYTTITPGYGKQPVTVTSQYQPYPTCGAAGSDGKSCDQWKEDKYVSTVITDYNSKKVTVTDVEKPVTCFHTKSTITHYPTASVPAGHAYPTGSYGSEHKNNTKPWYEMYEKVHEIKYKELGAHGLPGYGGSGLCKSCDDEQPYKVKEYKDGKWSEYEKTAIYKAPTPDVKTYEKPGVYTEPAKDVTVTYTMTKPSEATTTAKAGVPVTYGGVTTEFKETGVKTCAYGAYETGKDENGNDVTSTVVKTVTVTVSTTGKYEVAKPTTTVYEHDQDVVYPTVSVYKPGVYHKDAQTVTITKAGQTASCDYKQTKTYPAEPKKTPVYGDEYPHGSSSSSKPAVETKTEHKPDYPVSSPHASKSSSKPDDKYPATSSAPSYPEYPASTPVYDTAKSSSTPCSSSTPAVETKTSSAPYYPETHASSSSSKPSVETETSSAPYYPEYPASSSTPVDDTVKASSTPCSSSTPAVETKTSSAPYYPETHVSSSSSKPAVETETSSAPYYPEYPASTSSKPSVETETSSAPSYPEYPASTPVYDTAKSSSTPCSSSLSTPVASQTKSEEYPASTPVYDNSYPPSGDKTSSAPSYPATTTVPHYDGTTSTPCPSSTVPVDGHKSSDYPEVPVAPSSVPVNDSYKSSAYPEVPVASSTAPSYDAYPTPSPASYEDNKPSQAPTPSKITESYPVASSAYPEEPKENSYNGGSGYGYTKRSGAVQRRQAAVAKHNN